MRSAFDHPLLALPKFGDGPGLHRVQALLNMLAFDPALIAERSLVITGSNGKGSTAAIAASLMGALGEKVGLFTSPHLYRYHERFQVDGKPVEDKTLTRALDQVQHAIVAYGRRHSDTVGAFEAQFVAAMILLHEAGARWWVLEAGIGGRYDPVRMARAAVTGLVSLDLEHTELLGRTLSEIACDKLDATATGGLCILGETALPLRAPITTYASLRHIEVRFLEGDQWRDLGVHDGRQAFDLPGLDNLSSSLIGRHQINNHAVAVELCRERMRRSGVPDQPRLAERWRDAIAGVRWPGRLERIHNAPPVVIDVGHTPRGVTAALEGLQRMHEMDDALLVTGVSHDKDARAVLGALAPQFGRILVTAPGHKGLAADEAAMIVRQVNQHADIGVAESVAAAAVQARAYGGPVYVAGGLFLAAEFASAWRGEDPSALSFF